MRRKGQRGRLPSKHIPIRPKYKRVVPNEDLDSGVAHGPVDVDAVMAAHFDAESCLTDVPRGIDPFAEEETSIQKKVVWRPNKSQMAAITNKKKHGQVVQRSGEAGYAPVQHEKVYLDKNSDRLPAVWSVPTMDYHERVETAGLEQFARPSEQHNPRQEQISVSSTYSFDYEPYIPSRDEQTDQHHHRKVQSIQEVVQARIQLAQYELGFGSAIYDDQTSGKSKVRAMRSQVGKYDEESQGNQWGDLKDEYMDPDYEEVNLKDRRQQDVSRQTRNAGKYLTEDHPDHDANSVVQGKRRVQFAPADEDAGSYAELILKPSSDKFNNVAQHRAHQAAAAKTTADREVDYEDQAFDEVPVKQNRRHQANPRKKQSSLAVDVSSIASSKEVASVDRTKRRVQFDKEDQRADEFNEVVEEKTKPTVKNSRRNNPTEKERVSKSIDDVEPRAAVVVAKQRRAKQAEDIDHQVADPTIELETRSRPVAAGFKAHRVQAEPDESVYITQKRVNIDTSSRDRIRAEKSKRMQQAALEEQDSQQQINGSIAAEVPIPTSNRRVHSAKPANELSIPTTNIETTHDDNDVVVASKRRPKQANKDNQQATPNHEGPTIEEIDESNFHHRRNNPEVNLEAGQVFDRAVVATEHQVPLKQRKANLVDDAKINKTANPTIVSTDQTGFDQVQIKGDRRTQQQLEQAANAQYDAVAIVEHEQAVKQRDANLVNEADINRPSGQINPNEINAGIDPVSLDAAHSKDHVARAGSIHETHTVSFKADPEGERTGLEVNTRAREPVIRMDMNSGANKTAVYRRKGRAN